VNYLHDYINRPHDWNTCYNLALEYYGLGQWAGAQSFFSRCAELTYDDEQAYECLLYMGECFYNNGERNESARQCALHAIALKPGRPEAYYFHGLYAANCIEDYWQDVYTNSCTGLEVMKNNPPKLFKKLVEQGLWFNKAWSAYYVNRIQEASDLWAFMNLRFDLLPDFKGYVKNNIKNNKVDPNFTQLGNLRRVTKEVKEEVMNEKIYEREFVVKEGDIVVDIGANVGGFTHSIIYKKPKKVYCVEPSKKLMPALELNVKNNNVEIIQKAICDPDKNTIPKAGDAYGNKNSEQITFKQFISENNIEKIDFLKIDSEGGEYSIFTEENLDWITKNVSRVACEFHLGTIDNWYDNFKKFRELYLPKAKFFKSVFFKDNDDTTQKIYDDAWLDTFCAWAGWQSQLIFYIDFKEENPTPPEKLDIVIQGKYDDYVDELAAHYKQLYFINNVIISCWKDDKQSSEKDRVRFVRSEIPIDPGTGNRNLQIESSYAGIKSAETEYVIKVRSDQKYTHESLTQMYNFFMKNKERSITFESNDAKPKNSIITGGIFSPFPFHPRDHIFFGNKSDLIDLFEIPHETPNFTLKYGIEKKYESEHYDKHIRTESYIGTHYCSNFNSDIKKYLKEPEKYLHDNSDNIKESLSVSDKITHKIFKPVPSRILNIEWPKYGWTEYWIDSQRDDFGERWEEDFKEE
tara:strand:+ start:9419 stop:11488 length:2070 start_codon:yes stop_codon:yes gene_type:complete